MKVKLSTMGKILEALGIAALLIAFVSGIHGDEWGELYLFIGGIAVFVIGRQIEKRWERRFAAPKNRNPLQPE